MAAKKKASASKTQKRPVGRPKKQAPQERAAGQAGESCGRGRQQLWAVILFVTGIFLLCVVIVPGQSLWNFLHRLMFGVFGVLAAALPAAVIYIAIMYTLEKTIGSIKHKLWQAGVLVALICSAAQVFSGKFNESGFIAQIIALYNDGVAFRGGGLVGGLIGWPLTAACGELGAKIIIILLIFLFTMILTGSTLRGLFKGLAKPYRKISENYTKKVEQNHARFDIDVDLGPDAQLLPPHPVYSESSIDIALTDEEAAARAKQGKEKAPSSKKLKKLIEQENVQTKPAPEPLPEKENSADGIDALIDKAVKSEQPAIDLASETGQIKEIVDKNNQTKMFEDDPNAVNYIKPPVTLLKRSAGGENVDVSRELKQNADKLVNTLKSFGVQTKIVNVCRGPAVTRYELQPSAGVKISKITNLADDIALNLAAAGVRIEAPIPNKPYVGIEVPNKSQTMVTIRDIIDSQEFEGSPGNLTVALGKDISGKVCVADLAKMPHLLIAGATGSGKSVCINSFIMSLIYKSSPEDVKLLMVDPKVVELGVYNGIPHLLIPVVTDPRKAAGALNWAVTEMLKRYKIFADNSVRDLKGFNELAAADPQLQKMPQIVIIIDELSDLMMAAPKEVEDAICRLAQMARAAGMHLVIATQRPSVDVITGVIKANIPSRVAFAVSSQVDSRTILDSSGAEKLLGRGDMLFSPVGYPKPKRIQGCFVTDKEVEQVIGFIKNKQSAAYDEQIIEEIDKQAVAEKGQSGQGGGLEDEDEMIPAAIECILDAGQASTSFLQRRLRLGYARAGRIIDILEEKGIVGPSEGSKPRQVLITRQQYLEMTMNRQQDTSEAEAGEDNQ